MEFVPFIVLSAMLKKILDWVRVLIPDQHEAKVLIPISWVVGILLALLFSASEVLGSEILIFNDVTLATADVILVIVYGFAIGSAGGVIHDWVKPSTPPHDGT